MSGDGGMDMGGASLFQVTNKKIAKLFWYFVVATVVVCIMRRCLDFLRTIYAYAELRRPLVRC